MGVGGSREDEYGDPGEIEYNDRSSNREREDVFKTLFRTLSGTVTGNSLIRSDRFREAWMISPEALDLLAVLAPGGKGASKKKIAEGDTRALMYLFDTIDTDCDGLLSWGEVRGTTTARTSPDLPALTRAHSRPRARPPDGPARQRSGRGGSARGAESSPIVSSQASTPATPARSTPACSLPP